MKTKKEFLEKVTTRIYQRDGEEWVSAKYKDEKVNIGWIAPNKDVMIEECLWVHYLREYKK